MTDDLVDRLLPVLGGVSVLAALALVLVVLLDFAGVIRVEQLHEGCCCAEQVEARP